MSVGGAGEPIARGRDAGVYALGDGRVLRRYRAPGPTGRELRVMAWARTHGYPVPQVYEPAQRRAAATRSREWLGLSGLNLDREDRGRPTYEQVVSSNPMRRLASHQDALSRSLLKQG